MSASRQKRLEQAQIRVLLKAPFFAAGVARLPVVWDDSFPTAYTDGREIRWNPEFFDKLKDQELVTVLCHEVCHPLLGHLWRFDGCEHDLANQAADHAVNLMLKEFSAVEVGKAKADPFPFPEPADAYCADPRYTGWNEERIYSDLANRPRNQGGQSKTGVGQGAKQGGGNVQSIPKGAKTSPSGLSAPKNGIHSMPSFGQFKAPSAAKPGQSDAKKLKSDWEGVFIQSVASCKGQGNLPGMLDKLLAGLLKPAVPWPELLRQWLRQQAADDWDWLKPDLALSDGSGFLMPSLNSESMGPVVFGSDWSGSTQGELVEKFHVEKQSCLDEMRPAKLVDIGFDTKVCWEKEYLPGETIDKRVAGGGGTSFVDFFRRVGELVPAPRAVVVLTDLDGEFPDEAPPFGILWITWEKSGKAPFGEVIFAEQAS